MGGLKLGPEAQDKFEEAKREPDAQGFLEKKGAKRKNWNARWFVLKENYLFYCKTERSNPQGIVNLHGCTITRVSGPTITKAFCFTLLAPKSVSIDAKWTGRTYFMAAKTEKEMEFWTKKLEESGRRAAEKAAEKRGVASPQGTPKKEETVQPATMQVTRIDSPRSNSDSESEDDEKPAESPKVEEKKEEEKKEERKEEVAAGVEATVEKKEKKDKGERKEKKSKSSKKSSKEKKERKEKKAEESKPTEAATQDAKEETSAEAKSESHEAEKKEEKETTSGDNGEKKEETM